MKWIAEAKSLGIYYSFLFLYCSGKQKHQNVIQDLEADLVNIDGADRASTNPQNVMPWSLVAYSLYGSCKQKYWSRMFGSYWLAASYVIIDWPKTKLHHICCKYVSSNSRQAQSYGKHTSSGWKQAWSCAKQVPETTQEFRVRWLDRDIRTWPWQKIGRQIFPGSK